MPMHSRRNFMKLMGLGSLVSLTPSLLNGAGNTTPHIVIIGGGFSGATCAKYLKMWGGSSINVTVIESNATYVSPILSNLVLNGQKTTADLSFTYGASSSKYGITMLHHTVSAIDTTNKSLTLSNSQTLSYDKLVLAAGIDFEPVNAYDYNSVPHAWQSGAQINLLKSHIDAMADGDTFVMSIPPSPYRCPPGPYERACVVADYLKNTKGYRNCKVIVLDANPKIIVEEATFSAAFAKHGVDYRASCDITAVNDAQKSVSYTQGGASQTLTAKVLNIIPKQKAAPIVFSAGLVSGGWAPVNPLSYESTLMNDVYIIGDSQGTGQPKAGHIGNSEAKICADAILRNLNNVALYAAPKTNSACYSPTSKTEASWLSAVYRYDSATQSMVLAHKESGPSSTQNYKQMFLWSENLFADTFA